MIQDVPLNQRKDLLLSVKDDNTNNTYDHTPVSQFAKDMLNKMGYQEGKPIGKNSKTTIHQPIEFLKREERQGLGVNPMKSFKPIDEKQSNDLKFKQIIITKGKYKSLEGVILEVKKGNPTDQYIIELKISGDKIKLEPDQFIDKGKQQQQQNQKEEKSRSRSKEKVLNWVTPGIVVKVKNKHNKQLFNKKVVIQDVISDTQFSILTSEGILIDNLSEKDVKPTLPKKYGNVCIINGEMKGEVGIFVQKLDKKRVLVKLQDERLFEFGKKNVCKIG